VRRKIKIIEGNEKCQHLKKIDLQRDVAAGVYLSEAQNPILPPPLHTVYIILNHKGAKGGGRVNQKERERGNRVDYRSQSWVKIPTCLNVRKKLAISFYRL
jgi:hypothetical protein